MGIFGSSDQADIVANAKGESVTEGRLFEKSGRIIKRLETKPIIDYLLENEQPHFILKGSSKGLETRSGDDVQSVAPGAAYNAFFVVSDQRIGVLAGNRDGDRTVFFDYEDVQAVDFEEQRMKFRVRFRVSDSVCTFHSGKKYGRSEVGAAVEYVQSRIPEPEADADSLFDSEENQESSDDQNVVTQKSSSDRDAETEGAYIAEQAGPTVTLERVRTIQQFLRAGESVFHILRLPMLHHGREAETKSMSTKVSKTGTAAFTEDRIVIRIPHWNADDQFSIRYENVEAVAYNLEGFTGHRIFEVTTPGETYKLSVHQKISDGQVRHIVDWLDQRAAEDGRSDTGGESKSAPERLSELEALLEAGHVTQSEYQDKKEEIIEEL